MMQAAASTITRCYFAIAVDGAGIRPTRPTATTADAILLEDSIEMSDSLPNAILVDDAPDAHCRLSGD